MDGQTPSSPRPAAREWRRSYERRHRVSRIRRWWFGGRIVAREHGLKPWRKKLAPDGPRYKALGNSMAVNVMRWVGQRIAACEEAMGEGPA